MSDVITHIFDRKNKKIAEIEPLIQSVTWRLNNTGVAKFFLPYEDDKCTQDNLRYGNRLVFQFENGLPDWGGVIDTPRKQNQAGVFATGYTAEKMLDWRVTAKARYLDSATPGEIYETLIQEENADFYLGIEMGEIYKGGTLRHTEYHHHDLLKRMIDLKKKSGHDFAIIPSYVDGVLRFAAAWYLQRGQDKRDSVHLVEGKNILNPQLDEQGQIGNRIILVGGGSTWDDDRITSTQNDNTSQGLYGLREWARVQSGVTNQETLDANAEELLAEMKSPRRKFRLSVMDKAPGLFASYGLGDIVNLSAFLRNTEWAYEGPVRINGRTWMQNNQCKLEVEQWVS
jgi:hypothetical protein